MLTGASSYRIAFSKPVRKYQQPLATAKGKNMHAVQCLISIAHPCLSCQFAGAFQMSVEGGLALPTTKKWANISLPHLEGIISKSHHSIHLFSTTYSYHKVVSINSV